MVYGFLYIALIFALGAAAGWFHVVRERRNLNRRRLG
jgi:hypothetical protein